MLQLSVQELLAWELQKQPGIRKLLRPVVKRIEIIPAAQLAFSFQDAFLPVGACVCCKSIHPPCLQAAGIQPLRLIRY
jgi:hypothetical protein